MKKINMLALMLIIVVSVLALAAAPFDKGALARLEVINKTNQPVYIMLRGCDAQGFEKFFYLTTEPKTTKTFTVDRLEYRRTTWSCGWKRTGYLDMTSNVRLVFTSCYKNFAPNPGEPTLEKVHLKDTPWGIWWRYQH